MVAEVNSTGATSSTFTVPTTALNGATRMRVQMQYGAYQTNPCATYTYGEVEDYTVNITGNAHNPVFNDGAEPNVAVTGSQIADMKLYPNPAQDNVTIEYNSEAENAVRINIYNISGQRVLTYERSAVLGFNSENIYTHDLGNGVYILELASNGDVRRQRFVVQK